VSTLYNNIPEELKERRQWVCYRIEIINDRPTKVPYNFNGGAHAASNDPLTWGTFDQCLGTLRTCKRFDGIGFIVSADDPYTVIDLDHCVSANEETGIITVSDYAKRILNDIDTYAEFSQSGKGIHIICRASKPGPRCRTAQHPDIEIYDSVRFLVMTGNLVPNTCGVIQPAPNEIAALYTELFGAEETKQASTLNKGTPSGSAKQVDLRSISDTELINRAIKADNGDLFFRLWSGDLSTVNNDHSAADLALCNLLAFWTGCDISRIDRIFQQSALYREKWDRQDYKFRTIGKAVGDCKEIYDPSPRAKGPTQRAVFTDENGHHQALALSDLGNAEYLIQKHGARLRYDVTTGRWLHWTGIMWQPGSTGEINRLACESIRDLYRHAKALTDPDKAAQLYTHIRTSERCQRIDAMISMARYLPNVPVTSSDLNRDPWLINCQNGTLNLRNGTLQAHDPEDLITRVLPIPYEPNAACSRWLQFLQEVFCEDNDLISFVHRMCGYILTGDTREESVFILIGKGSNGKSKFVETLTHILARYYINTPVSTFMEKKNTNTDDLAMLDGARLVTASEGDETESFDEGTLKRLTGRDPITCRHLYQKYFTYIPTFKVLFSTNEMPRIKSHNRAMKRRMKIIPFNQCFHDPSENLLPLRDENLMPKLLAEAPGIFAWMVAGCLAWQKQGLGMAVAVKQAINNTFDTQDALAEFLEEECCMESDASVTTSAIWNAYQAWCTSRNRKPAFKQATWFVRSLNQRDGIDSRRSSTERFLVGIRLQYSNEFATGNRDSNDANDAHNEQLTNNEQQTIFPDNASFASLGADTDDPMTRYDANSGFSEKSLYACKEVSPKSPKRVNRVIEPDGNETDEIDDSEQDPDDSISPDAEVF
jgi:putative DNA primase/helicase